LILKTLYVKRYNDKWDVYRSKGAKDVELPNYGKSISHN